MRHKQTDKLCLIKLVCKKMEISCIPCFIFLPILFLYLYPFHDGLKLIVGMLERTLFSVAYNLGIDDNCNVSFCF